MIPDKVIQDWAKNKKRIQDRLNRIKKRIKKFQKQEKHFEMRLRAIHKHEKEGRKEDGPKEDPSRNTDGLPGQSIRETVPQAGSSGGQEASNN
jgi:predicted ribosome quality control (RQC) complex YloA/Tae2 family protein